MIQNKVYIFILIIYIIFFSKIYAQQDINIYPPAERNNLLWIHHSVGGYWSHAKGTTNSDFHQRYGTYIHGGNGELALYFNNYILHHLEYNSQLADNEEYTNYSDWYHKFKWHFDKNDPNYLASNHAGGTYADEDLLHCYSQNTSYDEQGIDPYTDEDLKGQTNSVIMFKSCYPNSNIQSAVAIDIDNYNEVSAFLDSIGQPHITSAWGGAGGPIDLIQSSYIGLTQIFAQHPDVLFVIWLNPPMTSSAPQEARIFSDWMVNELLQDYYWNGTVYTSYPHENVLIFSFFSVLTGERTIPFYQADHNHHKFNPFLMLTEYTMNATPGFINTTRLAYSCEGPSGYNSHPASFGGALATKELINRLNIQWNKMHNIEISTEYEIPVEGQIANFVLDSTQTGLSLNNGVSVGIIDNISCHVFDGTSEAFIDLGKLELSSNALSYSYWYYPKENSVSTGTYTTVLQLPGVLESNYSAETEMDGFIKTVLAENSINNDDSKNNVIDVNTWSHVTFTWDGDTARYYIDGTQIISPINWETTLPSSDGNLFLGNGEGNLAGGIRNLIIYDRELSAYDVKNIFMSTLDSTCANIVPTALTDSAKTNEDLSIQINILSNDYDEDGYILPSTFKIEQEPKNGTIENYNAETGDLVYKPNENYFGTDTFNYSIKDNRGKKSNIASVLIRINPINDKPFFIGLPDTLTCGIDTTHILNVCEYVFDVDSDLEAMHWNFSSPESSIVINFDTSYCMLNIIVPELSESSLLYLYVADDSFAVANDSIVLSQKKIQAISDKNDLKINKYYLEQNYPNPFNSSTKIKFKIPVMSYVKLSVYNLIGEKISRIVDGIYPAGSYETELNMSGFPSGIYVYILEASNRKMIKKIVYIK